MSDSAATPHPVGQTIKARRKELHLTLAQVGAALGLANGNFIGMVERGERMPSDERLLALAQALDLDGRSLVAMKYRSSDRSAVDMLLAPPTPELPRMRRYLLGLCTNPTEVAQEFERAALGVIERIVFQVLLSHCIVPTVQQDPYAPRRLKERIATEGGPITTQRPDPRWFENEAATFISWAKGQSVVQSWTLDLENLEIGLVDRDGRQRRLGLVPGSGTAPSTAGQSPKTSQPDTSDLASSLRAEGLCEDDVVEILDLVDWKKSRRRKA